MATYAQLESSRFDGAPVELYEFVGTYRSYYMTSDQIAHVHQGSIYEPVSGLSRGSLNLANYDDDDTGLEVTIPTSAQIVKDYSLQVTPPSLNLTIYRFHRDASDWVVYSTGAVASIVTDAENSVFKIPSVFGSIMSGNIPSVFVQPPCNNVLFDDFCKVIRGDNSVTTTVTSVNGRSISIASTGGFPEGWFVGGEISVMSRNERRMISAQASATMTVNYEFSLLAVGTLVQVTAGCDHSYSGAGGCPKFSNQKNFGGLPFVPGESNNVFVSGVK